MSLGIPSILSDRNGVSNLITNYENGFVVKHGDGDDLAGKINLLIEDKKLWGKISANSQGIYKKLNWKNVYESYQNIYREML
jgi:glycosyltransferase involved in cell wall biosynthesis